MLLDGDSDFRDLTRAELEAALRRVDPKSYPLNYAKIQSELAARAAGASPEPVVVPESPQARRSVWYWTDLALGIFISGLAVYGIYLDDIVVIGRRGNAIHLRGHAVWIGAAALLVAAGGFLVGASKLAGGARDNSDFPRINALIWGAVRLALFVLSIAIAWQLGQAPNNRWSGP